MKFRNLAQIAVLLTAGCAPEVSRKDLPLEKGHLPVYTRLMREYFSPTATALQKFEVRKKAFQIEQETLAHLEEVIEGAATELLGRTIDFPKPVMQPLLYQVEVGDYRFFINWNYHNSALALKYVADHVGDALFSALPRAETLTATIDDYLFGRISLQETVKRIRPLEEELYKKLGISPETAKDNERSIDSTVGILGGMTMPKIVFPFKASAQISLNPAAFIGGKEELIHDYGHELYHAIIAEKAGPLAILFGAPYTQEKLSIVEQSCEVFADEFLKYVEKPQSLVAHDHVRDHRMHHFEEGLVKLSKLYLAPKEFANRSVKRYGHKDGPTNYKAQILKIMSTLGYDAYAELVSNLTTFEQVSNLAKVCEERKLTLDLAKELLRR